MAFTIVASVIVSIFLANKYHVTILNYQVVYKVIQIIPALL